MLPDNVLFAKSGRKKINVETKGSYSLAVLQTKKEKKITEE
jgi:hypothetical protein